MLMRPRLVDKRGFTLLELALALAILAVLASAAVPYAATQIRNQAAEKLSREMLAVADAAKSYYVQNSAWPASIAALQTTGFLPSSWSATNPWGNGYTISSSTTLAVKTTVPADVAPAVARLVPLGTQTTVAGGVEVAGTWPIPGQSSDLSGITKLRNAEALVLVDGRATTETAVDVSAHVPASANTILLHIRHPLFASGINRDLRIRHTPGQDFYVYEDIALQGAANAQGSLTLEIRNNGQRFWYLWDADPGAGWGLSAWVSGWR